MPKNRFDETHGKFTHWAEESKKQITEALQTPDGCADLTEYLSSQPKDYTTVFLLNTVIALVELRRTELIDKEY